MSVDTSCFAVSWAHPSWVSLHTDLFTTDRNPPPPRPHPTSPRRAPSPSGLMSPSRLPGSREREWDNGSNASSPASVPEYTGRWWDFWGWGGGEHRP